MMNGVLTDVLFEGSIADYKANGKLVLTADGIVVQETSFRDHEINEDQGGLYLYESVATINALIPEESKIEIKQETHHKILNQQQSSKDLQQQPAIDVQQQPVSDQQQSFKDLQQQPAIDVQQKPASDQQQPAKDLQQQPAKDLQQQPVSDQQQSSKDLQQQPAIDVQQQ